MTTITTRTQPRPRAQPRPAPLRLRADFTPVAAMPHALRVITAGHDFLVPNARPDLTSDVRTLRMLEAG